jgi:hypothetical protein
MAAKIALRAEAHVMSRGKEEGGREAEREGSRTLRRGQLQPTAKKRTVLFCLSVCLSVCLYTPPPSTAVNNNNNNTITPVNAKLHESQP